MTDHPALAQGRVAVVTGAASGIGLAAARRFAAMGMRVCLADLSAKALEAATSDPDNDVTRETDNRRILWAAQDITENRPPLSRWHPDYAAAFARFLADQ